MINTLQLLKYFISISYSIASCLEVETPIIVKVLIRVEPTTEAFS